jgi:hypothetical protein
MIAIAEFCDRNRACKNGREWAITNCSDIADAWQKLPAGWLIWVATREGVLTDKELRLFAVFCVRQVEHLLADQRSRDVILVAERFANGEATTAELAAARAASQAAANAAVAAWAASQAAAWDAAVAARDAAVAARDAAVAARDAAWAANAVRDAQADWLRKHARPNFEEVTE